MKHLMKKKKKETLASDREDIKELEELEKKTDRKQGPNQRIEAESRAELIDPALKKNRLNGSAQG